MFRRSRGGRKRVVLALATIALAASGFALSTHAQSAPSNGGTTPVQATRPQAIPPADQPLEVGRPIYAELSRTIDVKKAKAGEPIYAKVTLAVLSHGKVLISDGAKLTGHVTEARTRSKKNPESVLGIVFDRAELTDGTQLPLMLTVQAVGVGQLNSPEVALDAPNPPYSETAGTSTIPGPPHPRSFPTNEDSEIGQSHMALDVGSKGMVGLNGLELKQGDDGEGSLVTSSKKNVKLDSGYELVLRVIAPKPTPPGAQ